MLWQLTFYKHPAAARADGFSIGFFDSMDEIEAIKAMYAARLPGFREAPEGTWDIVGHAVDVPADGIVWRVVGHNWSEDCEECDLISSPVFAEKAAAEACLAELKARYIRDSLEIIPIQVNRRWWTEGFDNE